jgi:SAM-dependent methyltransferase
VTALDFSEEMIRFAQARTTEATDQIEYLILDATDEEALLKLGTGQYDAALCNMALFDMAEIQPLMRVLSHLLKPDGRFVFSVLHPCFNNSHMIQMAEMEDRAGEVVTTYSVKIYGYITPTVARGVALIGQPNPQLYFHRPLEQLLGAGFEAGFVLDGLEERAFPARFSTGSTPLSWSGHFSEIPPVLVARMRLRELTKPVTSKQAEEKIR